MISHIDKLATPLSHVQWIIAAIAAFTIGISKTGFAGAGILVVAMFAHILPVKASTGTVLPLLIAGDIFAVLVYRRHASWPHLARMFPWAALGIVIGQFTLGRLDDGQVSRLIGGILVVLVIVQLTKMGPDKEERVPSRYYAPAMGLAAGFATMVANAAGPIMLIYLLAVGLPKLEFIGTGAWFFLVINLFKLPFSAHLGLITEPSLAFDLLLVPLTILGAACGRWLVTFVNQKNFAYLALAMAFVGGVHMIL